MGVEDIEPYVVLEKNKYKEVEDIKPDVLLQQKKDEGVKDIQTTVVLEKNKDKGVDVNNGVDFHDASNDGVNMGSDDSDEEWIGDTSQNVRKEDSKGEEDATEVMNNDELVSRSSSNEGENNIRKKSIRKTQGPHENENTLGQDENNCIYSVAYTDVDIIIFKYWNCILTSFRDDLDLNTMSNFTFITD
ncbi:hypothetical protein LXL04_028206 [Taraxacum kok-saghyz]